MFVSYENMSSKETTMSESNETTSNPHGPVDPTINYSDANNCYVCLAAAVSTAT